MKYSDYLKINDTFQYSINLQFDIGNINKIKEYIPTSDSCEVLEKYIDSILGNFNKATTLLGPYGKGKSHLMLVLLTLLNDYSEEDFHTLNELIKKISKINDELAGKIKRIRDKKQKYLPVIINSNYNNMNQAFLLAIYEALERDNLNGISVNTYFESALNIIEKWENDEDTEVIDKFNKCLSKYNTTLDKIKISLKMFDDTGYNEFKDVYKCVMHGVEFNPITNTDIIKYYKDVNYKINQLGYNGLIIVFDEFSKFLEYTGNENMMRDLKIIQDFAELASRTGKSEQILFTCITHKTISEYLKNIKDDKINAFKTVEGRFKEIPFNRSMEQNYEIISQTIIRRKEAKDIISKEIEKNKEFYNELTDNFKFCRTDNNDLLFKWCYPLNPVTVFSVIELSEKIAQNERTLFTFLTDDDSNSFKYFINNSSKDLFNLDKVYNYFYLLLKKENDERIKEIWIKTDTALSKTENATERKILKAISIIYMLNDEENIVPSEECIRLSLNLSKETCNKSINNLLSKSIIKIKKSNKFFDFTTIYNKEITQEIQRIRDTKFNTIDLKTNLMNIADTEYIIPRKYNQKYKMTRFFKEIYLTADELLKLNSLKVLEQQYFADGLVIEILLKNEKIVDIENKVAQLKNNKVVFIIPKKSISDELINSVKDFESIEYIKRVENNDDDVLTELNLIQSDEEELINNEMNMLFDTSNIKEYLYQDEKYKHIKINSLISDICENIYCETPIINNEMINKETISTPIIKARGIVIESVLNDDVSLIKSETSAEATIYNATVKIKENKDIRNIVNIIEKYIKDTEKTGKRNFEKIYDKLVSEPFGIRKGILPILLAIAIQEYSENVILYYQDREIEVNQNNVSKVFDEPNKYYLYVEKGTEEKLIYIKNMADIFNCELGKIERNNIKNIVYTMKSWSLSLPKITRDLVEADDIVEEQSFINIKNILLKEDLNVNEFVFEIIPEELNEKKFNVITAKVSLMKEKFDNYVESYIQKQIIKFKEIFSHNSKSNLNSLLSNWYKKIDDELKNTITSLDTKNILEYINQMNTFNDIEIFQRFSEILLGYSVEDWDSNSSKVFFEKINNIIEEVKNLKKVDNSDKEVVEIKLGNDEIKKYINATEVSPLGNTLKNNIEDSIDEYGNSISESEKIKILLDLIKKYL